MFNIIYISKKEGVKANIRLVFMEKNIRARAHSINFF